MSMQSHRSSNPKLSAVPSVVVVSRNAMQCHFLGSLLEHHGARVWKAQSGEQAFRLLEETGPVHAIVIDWEMQGESAQGFCELLNAPSFQAYQHIPILALSSQFSGDDVENLLQFGVVESLTLPIHPQRFLASIDKVLNDGRLAESTSRVLIVSPSMSQDHSLSQSLQEKGWTAHVTTSVKETRQMLKELCPDLVLLHHPVIEEIGLELVDDIKSRHPEMAVFLVSDYDGSSFALEALQHGVDEVIRSPLTGQYVHALWEKMQKLCRRPLGSVPEPETSRVGAFHDHTSIARLAGKIAHDVNNVLTSILGHAGVLSQRPEDKNAVLQSTQIIEQATRRGKELTAKLLRAISRQQERRESVNLCDIIKEVLDLVQPETSHSIHVQQRLYALDHWVKGDDVELHQIVLNLIINACDAMSQGGTLIVETQTTMVDAESAAPQKMVGPGRYLELMVRDTGCGIPEDVLPHIFEVFFTTKEQGSGIGLATVREVVQKNGGSVTVESQVTCGTAVHVLLPQVSGKRRSIEKGYTNQEKRHVLVVDDDPVVGQTAAEILEFLGHDVTVVGKGKAAIDLVRTQTDLIDVVLLDMAMEPMDGPTCYRALRLHNPTIPVIFTSGYGQNPEVQQLFDEGLAGFVQKPYDVEELTALLAQAYRGHSHKQHETFSIPASVAEEIV